MLLVFGPGVALSIVWRFQFGIDNFAETRQVEKPTNGIEANANNRPIIFERQVSPFRGFALISLSNLPQLGAGNSPSLGLSELFQENCTDSNERSETKTFRCTNEQETENDSVRNQALVIKNNKTLI